MNLKPNTVYVQKENEAYIRVFAEPSILQELSDHFTFTVPDAQFKKRYVVNWDGNIRLLDRRTNRLYYGLIEELEKTIFERGYKLIKSGFPEVDLDRKSIVSRIVELIKELNIHSKGVSITPHDFQLKAVLESIFHQRKLIVSATASGKSLVIYILIQYLLKYFNDCKILLVVPRTSLVEQMFTDFEDYSTEIDWDVSEYYHKIYSGKEKHTDKPIVCTTWQSIYKMPKEWFEQFTMIIGDEAHGFQAKSLISIMTNLENCFFRIGTTGTVQDTKVHQLVLQGLFGNIFVASTTKELQDQNIVSDILVKGIVLNYSEEFCKKYTKMDFDTEMKFLENLKPRNEFICNLLKTLKGNTLVLFKHLDHGEKMYNLQKKLCQDQKRKIFYICGEVETDAREKIRKIIEYETDAIIFATFGTFKEGININRLHNTFYAISIKSPITIKQSIGRGLRKGSDKDKLNHYDLMDKLSYKSYKNHSWRHALYRMQVYTSEQFNQKYYKFKLV